VPLPMEGVLAAAASVAGVEVDFVRVDEDWLLDRGVEPFEELPLWLATRRHPGFRGFFAIDVARANEAGLVHRPVAATVAQTLAWQGEVVEKDLDRLLLPAASTPGRSASFSTRGLP
jgi:hypothetical protein